MVVARVLMMLCVAVAFILSEAPGTGAELVSSPLRQLMEEVVKVHVMVHQKEVPPSTEHLHKHHKKAEKEEKGVSAESETVRDYDHGTVRIEANGAKAAEKYGKAHNEKNDAKQTQDDETVVEYKHGSVKIFSEKGSAAVDNEIKSTRGNAKKAATAKEQEITSTANDVNELVTKLSSTPSADKKSFHDTYGPVVVICGIIGGLAAIIGVAGLVMDNSQSYKDSLDLEDSAELDVDVEANIAPVRKQDDDSHSDSTNDDDSDSDSSNDDDEEEGSFANGTAHVSVIGGNRLLARYAQVCMFSLKALR